VDQQAWSAFVLTKQTQLVQVGLLVVRVPPGAYARAFSSSSRRVSRHRDSFFMAVFFIDSSFVEISIIDIPGRLVFRYSPELVPSS
jgi:hypothetical protein